MSSPLYQSGGGSGSATPGGSDGDIQYNNAGALGGETLVPLAHGGTNADLSATGSATAVLAQAANHVISARALIGADLPTPTTSTFGGVKDIAAVSTKFVSAVTSGVPVLTQPAFTDISGTAAAAQLPNPGAATKGGVFSKAAVSNQFLTAIGTDASVSQAQPAFTDISGAVTVTQGGTANFTSAGNGWFWSISNATAAAAIGVSQADVAQMCELVVPFRIVVTKMTIRCTTLSATAGDTTGVAVYDQAGTTLMCYATFPTGSADATGGLTQTPVAGAGGTTFNPGCYKISWAADHTDTRVIGTGSSDGMWNMAQTLIFNKNVSRSGTCDGSHKFVVGVPNAAFGPITASATPMIFCLFEA